MEVVVATEVSVRGRPGQALVENPVDGIVQPAPLDGISTANAESVQLARCLSIALLQFDHGRGLPEDGPHGGRVVGKAAEE